MQKVEKTDDGGMSITETLPVPVDVVWDAWAQPHHIENWWGPDGFRTTTHIMEFKPGGLWRLTLHGPDGKNYPNKSIYQEIIPFRKIAFEHANPHFVTTVNFKAIGQETQIVWKMLFDSAEMREVVIKAHQADKGLKQNMEKLKNYLNTKNDVMNSNLPFDFSVDRENKTITVRKEFAASPSLVWDAWTKPEILDQWWAPKPWKAKTKSMEFKEGGSWLYAMVGPEGEEHWSVFHYKKIEEPKYFSGLDGFTDTEGTINSTMPSTTWKVSFNDQGKTTLVEAVLNFKTLEDLETLIEMGFKEGFTMTLNYLDEFLPTL